MEDVTMKTAKKLLSVLLVVLMAFGCASVALADTETEPNETAAEATSFTIAAPGKGVLATFDDVDWYKVNLGTSMGLATFSFTHDGAGTDQIYFKVSVFDDSVLTKGETDKNKVASFSVKGNHKKTSSSPVLIPGGDYYVKVETGTVSMTYEYQVSVSLDANLNTETEDNNDKSNADEIVGTNNSTSPVYYGAVDYSSTSDGDIDFYKFQAPTGYFQIDFAALVPGVKYTVSAYSIPGVNYEPQEICKFTVTTEDNGEEFYSSAEVGVSAGTYFIKVTADNCRHKNEDGHEENPSVTSNANYKLRVYAKSDSSTEAEYNDVKEYATPLTLGKAMFASISKSNDIDYFKLSVKDSDRAYKLTVYGSADSNPDTASWKVNILDSDANAIDDYKNITVDMSKPLEIDLNTFNAGTYYIQVTGNSVSTGNYVIKTEAYNSGATPTPDGNFFQRVWARIKALPWADFWNNNFRELVLHLGGESGQIDLNGDGRPDFNTGTFKVLYDLFQLSIGTIIKIFN